MSPGTDENIWDSDHGSWPGYTNVHDHFSCIPIKWHYIVHVGLIYDEFSSIDK